MRTVTTITLLRDRRAPRRLPFLCAALMAENGWTGVNDENNGLFQSAQGPAPGTYEAGVEDYKVLKALGYPAYTEDDAKAYWTYDGTTFWSYDSPEIIGDKMSYVKQKGLGGAMVWELDGDTTDGELIGAVYNGL